MLLRFLEQGSKLVMKLDVPKSMSAFLTEKSKCGQQVAIAIRAATTCESVRTRLKYNIYCNILTKYVISVSTHNSVTSHDNRVFKERLTIVQFVEPGAENPDNGGARDHCDSTFS